MNEPLRVLHVLSNLNRGGVESLVLEWLRRIDRQQVAFDFIITHPEDRYDYEDEVLSLGGNVIRAPQFSVHDMASLASWWRRTFTEHDEWRVVHGHDPLSAFIYLAVARTQGRATIAHSHFSGPDRGLDGLVRTILRWPVRYIAQTRLACSSSAESWMFGRRSGNVRVQNGIDLAKFGFDRSRRERARRELGTGEGFVVGHIGRFVSVKNHTRVLRIFARLLQFASDARLILVGDGILRGQIEREIELLGLVDKVILTGSREDVPELLAAMDVLVLPSHSEGFSITVVEAQASGLPCVVSDAVPQEARLTDLVRYVSLDETDDVWADAVLGSVGQSERHSPMDELRAAGYDSRQVTQEMQQLYLELGKSIAQRGRR